MILEYKHILKQTQDADSTIKQPKIVGRFPRADVWPGCLDRCEWHICTTTTYSAHCTGRMELACAHGDAGAIRQFRTYTVHSVHKVSLFCFVLG